MRNKRFHALDYYSSVFYITRICWCSWLCLWHYTTRICSCRRLCLWHYTTRICWCRWLCLWHYITKICWCRWLCLWHYITGICWCRCLCLWHSAYTTAAALAETASEKSHVLSALAMVLYKSGDIDGTKTALFQWWVITIDQFVLEKLLIYHKIYLLY